MEETTVRIRTQLLFAAGLIAYPAAAVAAAMGWAWPFAVLALWTYLLEPVLPGKAPTINGLLSRGGAGWTQRSTVRNLLLVVLVSVTGTATRTQFVTTALCVALIEGARVCHSVAAFYTRGRRTLPVLTRNLDLSALRIPDAPHGLFDRIAPRGTAVIGIAPLIGVLASAFTGSVTPTLIGAVGGAAVAAFGATSVLAGMLRAIRVPRGETVLAEVNRLVQAYAPEVVVYFSGTPDSLYQINMWLDVVATLDRPVLVLLRERANIALLGPTSLPVVCLPSAIDLMNFDLPSVRLAMYPANVGKNIHFLRLPGVTHVFIGHGDSDKIASVNPFSKAYDEVWVAGRAGRDRYARAGIGVEDRDVIEVGRPQLASIRGVVDRGPTEMLTVLYAPTWEGWTDEPQNTSIITMGPIIVARLLAHPYNVRVIYKPHPFTGTRSRQAAASHNRILAMIEAANADRVASARFVGNMVAARKADVELATLRSAIDAIEPGSSGGMGGHRSWAGRGGWAGWIGRAGQVDRAGSGDTPGITDDAAAARDSGRPHPDYAAEVARLTAAWSAAYWSGRPAWMHRIVTESLPTLYDCFNASDLLVTDISSVVADYLRSGKPYVVTNSADLADDVFRTEYPTAGAAYLLGFDCADLSDIVTDTASGGDQLWEERRKLRTYLLGSDDDGPVDRFRAAADAVLDRGGPAGPGGCGIST